MDPASKKHLQPGMQSKGAFGSVKSLKDGSSGSNVHDLTDSRPPHVLSKHSNGMFFNIYYKIISSRINSIYLIKASGAAVTANAGVSGNVQAATPNSRIKRSTSAVDIKNPRPGISKS